MPKLCRFIARVLQRALVYLARPRAVGRPKAGYVEIVVAAVRLWALPEDYIDLLKRWLPLHSVSGGTRKLDFG